MKEIRAEWGRDFFIPNERAIRRFARFIGDPNPLHHDTKAAKALGLHGIIAPGVMVIGFVSTTIASEISEVLVNKLQMEFKEPLYAGSLITVFCTVLRQRRISAEVFVTVKNGFQLLAEGSCLLVLPRD